MNNKRIFVSKKKGFQNTSSKLLHDFKDVLGITNLKGLNHYVIYDLFDIESDEYEKSKELIFSEITSDNLLENIDLNDKVYLAVEPLVNQFDQRAESAKECLFLINPQTKCDIKTGELLVFEGITKNELEKIKKYYINPIENQIKDLSLFQQKNISVDMEEEEITNFNQLNQEELIGIKEKYSIGLSINNLRLCQDYFKLCNRDPRVCELKVLDTYWSDHCRHSTFNTNLENIIIKDNEIKETFDEYLNMQKEISPNKSISLMNIATIYGKYANINKIRTNIEDTIEDNAISLIIKEENKEFLYLFKNETHNHPTEIEPFGGASTCIGGAIRDPLSSRAYVYQGIRLSGASDINESIEKTIEGKLPQRIISQKSAHGFSSYGNQIGIATSLVKEIYHPGYVAKHFEAGAVIGVAKRENVIRKNPQKDDLILLIGGRTGYDGIGGATGSSKVHTENSIVDSAIEVQKGNAPIERNIQRLFKNGNATKLIKKCNDFGAGGISVAIGELSDSIEVYLDKVPLKTRKLKPRDIALSESQERMAVVISPDSVNEFIEYCENENLEATVVAKVTYDNHLKMFYQDQVIVDLNRDFIATNGVKLYQDVVIDEQSNEENKQIQIKEKLLDPNIIDNKYMDMMFDSTVGGKTVLMPYGGKYEQTKNQVSVHKIPYTKNLTSHATYGFNPYMMESNPYIGAQMSVVDSITKLVASGVKLENINLSFQEYFNNLGDDKEKWGAVLSALLGSFKVQRELKVPSLGGKDSMSGTYKDINVPSTLVSFAFGYSTIDRVISSEAKKTDEYIYLLHTDKLDYQKYLENIKEYEKLVSNKDITASFAVSDNGIAISIMKMLMGNKLGANVTVDKGVCEESYGSIIFTSEKELKEFEFIGKTNSSGKLVINDEEFDIEEIIESNNKYFSNVYPVLKENKTCDKAFVKKDIKREYNPTKTDKPKVLITIFNGTNSEIEMQEAFEREGADVKKFIFRNLNEKLINKSIDELAKEIEKVDIIAIPGGFSGGDEPDGSGKYIVNVLHNEKIKKAIHKHLDEDKLILGICNGFQALIKSGLITHGRIVKNKEEDPTLFSNDCVHHISKVVRTNVQTKNSPWLKHIDKDKVYTQVISHGEGKIACDEKVAKRLFENDQVAFCYDGLNPNGSMFDIEGLISPCGKVLGKMAHSERYDGDLYLNIEGNKKVDIFKSSIKYFKGE